MYSIFSVATLLSWIRGLTYFRLFESTRYLVNLLFEVAKDVSGFLILLSYSTLAFCFIFIVLSKGDNINMMEFIISSYGLALGNYPDEQYNFIEFFVVTCALIINPIIMLNLLISIISDTYERIMTDMVSADAKELIDMIIEVENLLFTKRNEGTKKYIQIVKEYEKDEDQTEWEGKMRAIEKNIDKINKANQILCDMAIIKIEQEQNPLIQQTERLDRIIEFTRNLSLHSKKLT